MGQQEKARLTPESAVAQAYREDSPFRKEFDDDPKAAIAKLMGAEFPPNVKIVVRRRKRLGKAWLGLEFYSNKRTL